MVRHLILQSGAKETQQIQTLVQTSDQLAFTADVLAEQEKHQVPRDEWIDGYITVPAISLRDRFTHKGEINPRLHASQVTVRVHAAI